MNTFYQVILTVAMFTFYSTTWAEVKIDPCGYGCPKDNCPNCPTGGPIGAKTKADSDAGDSAKSIAREKASPSPIKQKAANSCDFCVCDRGTVKPSCTECCK